MSDILQLNPLGDSMIHTHLRADPRPLYAQASEALKELVLHGGYAAGARLPSEHELSAQLGISRPTLREALRLLEEEGLIARRHGVGTFVAIPQPIIEGGLEILESLAQLAQRRGLRTGVEALHIEARPATAVESAQLKIAAQSPVTTIARVIVTGPAESRQRVAFLTDVVPPDVLGEADLTADFAGSVLDLLQARGRPALSHSATELSAEAADLPLARALHVARGAALLKIEAQLYACDGRVVDYSTSYFVSGHVRFRGIRRLTTGELPGSAQAG